MTDIVERLRGVSPALGAGTKLCGEAADEIELLRDTLKRHAGDVKDAMQEIERLEGDVKFAKKVMAAKDDEIERLKAEFELFREAPSKLEVAQYEIERLREKVEMVMSINHQQGEEIERLRAALGEKP